MTKSRTHVLSSKYLATEWRALGLWLVLFVRQVLQMSARDPRRAAQAAQQAEMVCYAAAGSLSQQVALLDETTPTQSDEADSARSHMLAMAAALLTLAVFLRRLIGWLAPERRAGVRPARTAPAPRPASFQRAFDYFDTS